MQSERVGGGGVMIINKQQKQTSLPPLNKQPSLVPRRDCWIMGNYHPGDYGIKTPLPHPKSGHIKDLHV